MVGSSYTLTMSKVRVLLSFLMPSSSTERHVTSALGWMLSLDRYFLVVFCMTSLTQGILRSVCRVLLLTNQAAFVSNRSVLLLNL